MNNGECQLHIFEGVLLIETKRLFQTPSNLSIDNIHELGNYNSQV